MTETDLPLMHQSNLSQEPRSVSVQGILLAGGMSRRYGAENKLLATMQDEPLVRHAARAFLASALTGTIVVLGHEADRVREALSDLPVTFVINEAYASGQAAAVRRGVEAVQSRDPDAVLIGLGDMPAVRADTIDLLVDAYARDAGGSIAAAYRGQRGNPVLFDRKYLDRLTDVEGDTGARDILLTAEDGILLETDDPGVLRDINTPQDLDNRS